MIYAAQETLTMAKLVYKALDQVASYYCSTTCILKIREVALYLRGVHVLSCV